MASEINFQLVDPNVQASDAVARAQRVFADLEAACTRFDSQSPLMLANAAGDSWYEVPRVCFEAIKEAYDAYVATKGVFDPRVLKSLTANGYDNSLPFTEGNVEIAGMPEDSSTASPDLVNSQPWRPQFESVRSLVRIGSEPIDLGGIGKGLAVRLATAQLNRGARACLVDAGGDCFLSGAGPDGHGWRVAIEDPRGGSEPVAVLNVIDAGCATSSTRVRNWKVGKRRVHHLIDPRTGQPGGAGLRSVTVVGPDTAQAEVWSKTLFLAGLDDIAAAAAQTNLAAFWVTETGNLHWSEPMAPHIIWTRPESEGSLHG